MTMSLAPGLSPDGSSPDQPSLVAVASAAFGASIQWWGYGLSLVGGALGLCVALWRDNPHPLWQGALAAIAMLTIPLVVLALVLASPASFEVGRLRRGVNGLVALPFVALLFSNLYHAQIDPYWPALPAVLAIVVSPLPQASNAFAARRASPTRAMLLTVVASARRSTATARPRWSTSSSTSRPAR